MADPDDIKPVAELPDPLGDALREASDRGFETDDVDEELLAAIDELREPGSHHRLSELYVRIDGTDYVAELQIPELEIRLAEETIDEYDPDQKVTRDDEFENDEVDWLVRRIGWDGSPQTTRSPYRLSSVPKEIEAFLEDYEYVEDFRGVSRIETVRHDWDPPYSIELRSFEEERWGNDVLEAQTLDDDVREVVEMAVETVTDVLAPPFVTDDVPDGFYETFMPASEESEPPFVRVEDTVYHVGLSEGDHGTMPIDVTADPVSSADDGLARFTLTIEATEEKPDAKLSRNDPIELHSHVGVPSALWIPHGEENHLLKSDQYEFEVLSKGDETVAWSLDIEGKESRELSVTKELSIGDELVATYVIPGTVPDGTYVVRGNFAALWYEDPDDVSRTDGIYPFQIELTVESS